MNGAGPVDAIAALVSPRSIAVIGASADFTRLSGRPIKHLLDKGYRGRIHPVNPRHARIGPLACFATVGDIPGDVDLAIVAVPARDVPATIEALGAKRVPAAIVFSSGFGEVGGDGIDLERQVREAARRNGVRVCGPNCLGLINAFDRVLATFSQYAADDTPAGPVAFVSQSGAFGTAIAALARARGVGLGYFVNTGNESDVSFAELMSHLADDARIRVCAGYIEGVKDGPALIAVAEHMRAIGKPLVLTKVGRSAAGRRAAASHTGSLAGEDRVFDAVIRQHGVIRARNEEQMLDLIEVLTDCALPGGRGVGMVTQSGGAGVLMADRAEERGLVVPRLAAATRAALAACIPSFGTVDNPVDVTGQFLAEPGLLRESLVAVLDDPDVHVGVVWLQLMHGYVDEIVSLFADVKARVRKPFVVAWVSAPQAGLGALKALGIPVLRGAEPAIDAVAGLVDHAQARRRWTGDTPARRAPAWPAALELPARGGPLPTLDAARLLAGAGVKVAPFALAGDVEAAVRVAQSIGYPVVVKIESPDILHKTEIDGVRLGLASDAAVRAAFHEVTAAARARRPEARIDGVIVQAMARGRAELVVGLTRDAVFGNMVLVGLGGIHVEILGDVSLRRCPVDASEAGQMLDELRGAALLRAFRGRPAVDRGALVGTIVAVSRLGAALGERLGELDVNPLLVDEHGAVAVDVLLTLAPVRTDTNPAAGNREDRT